MLLEDEVGVIVLQESLSSSMNALVLLGTFDGGGMASSLPSSLSLSKVTHSTLLFEVGLNRFAVTC